MAKATQENRLLSIETPLGEDFLLLNKLKVTEGISSLFEIDVELLYDEEADDDNDVTQIDIQKILGQTVAVIYHQQDETERKYMGMVNRFTQIGRRQRFSYYSVRIVPSIWRLTQIIQSRIFQRKSVPDILAEVFEGFQVRFQLKKTYQPRNYTVQYNESDYDFASRLMEEEGIYFYFDHSEEVDKLVVRDEYTTPEDCPNKSDVPMYDIDLGKGGGWQGSVISLSVDYNLRSGKQTLWDYNLQLPGKKLDATITSSKSIGGNQDMETYLYPGGYAKRYDGIDPSGSEKRSDLDTIFSDNKKAVENNILAIDSQHKVLRGISDCASLTAGYRFHLKNNPTREMNMSYIVLSITHTCDQTPSFESESEVDEAYTNEFTCIPHGSGFPEFRPERKTPKPIIQGSQTAFIVGPAGDEIYTDKLGRVKAQFQWDRDGKSDESSSCWIPVAQTWAGNRWGSVFIPRIGMEVIVDFLDGDPDRPLIKGCVYNPGAMPPYELPDEKTKSTIKSDSSEGGGGFNEIRFEDKKGEEQIFVHAQKDQDIRVKNDRRELIANDRHTYVQRDKREQIKRDEHKIVERDTMKTIKRDYHVLVEENRYGQINGESSEKIDGEVNKIYGADCSVDVAGKFSLTASEIVFDAQMGITLKCGGNFVHVTPMGVDIKGTMVNINSGGAAGSAKTAMTIEPQAPEEAHIADNADPGSKSPTYKNQIAKRKKFEKMMYGSSPSHNPNSSMNEDKKSWIEIELKDEEGNPVPGEKYLVTLPDGQKIASGTLDSKGYAKVSNIDPGNCKITFPDMDGRSWKKE